jgi:hypothetical protein
MFIDNSKIEAITAQWARFRGFSYLFDHPDEGRHLLPCGAGLQRIHCAAGAGLTLYDRISDALSTLLAGLQRERPFCLLPFASYHVTCWDGVNDANVAQVTDPRYAALLKRLPDAFAAGLPSAGLRPELFPAGTGPWPLRFRFSRLAVRQRDALVAFLEPADDASAAALQRVGARRRELDQLGRDEFNLPPGAAYTPHLSLGYFCNSQAADGLSARMDDWSAQVRKATGPTTIEFRSASVYAFTDMVTFFKAVR